MIQGRVGVWDPSKMDDVIYEQSLSVEEEEERKKERKSVITMVSIRTPEPKIKLNRFMLCQILGVTTQQP